MASTIAPLGATNGGGCQQESCWRRRRMTAVYEAALKPAATCSHYQVATGKRRQAEADDRQPGAVAVAGMPVCCPGWSFAEWRMKIWDALIEVFACVQILCSVFILLFVLNLPAHLLDLVPHEEARRDLVWSR